MQKDSILSLLLEKRGFKDDREIDIFLNPDYERDLHDPFLMRDMEHACERLVKAIIENEKIIIYADYDCDGIPGAVILEDLLKKIGYKNYEVYIPERNSEGYGLNSEAIKIFAEKNAKLLITIDLGITAVDEVEQAKDFGIDVVITDHHLPHAEIPKAYAILNPKIDDPAKDGTSYPEKMLCGAGVIFKFVQGFLKYVQSFIECSDKNSCERVMNPERARFFAKQKERGVNPRGRLAGADEESEQDVFGEDNIFSLKINNGWEKWLLDMAGLATLSDQVPLLGENRAIAYFGIKVLRKSTRPGLRAIFSKTGIDQKYLTEDDIGFTVVPKLNAASRMDSPMKAYKLLSADNLQEASLLAEELSIVNDKRKKIVANIVKEVKKKFETNSSYHEKNVIVVGNPSWRVGVLGLVASKICEEYKKPAFVWGKDENDVIKGSCRGDGSFSLVSLMENTREYFSEFGGHISAGGFSVHSEKIHFLEDALSVSYESIEKNISSALDLYDVKATLDIVNMKTWRELERLAPFGLSNEKPVFLFENTKIEKARSFGKNGSGEHLEITFSDDSGKKVKAISFFSGIDSFQTEILEGKNVNLLATFDLSRWRGKEELRLRVVSVY